MDSGETRGGLGDGDPGLANRHNRNYEPYAGFGVAVVLRSDRKLVLLDRSPLSPSRPGCAGDQGTIGHIRVVDVLETNEGLLHVLEEPKPFRAGQYVAIQLDLERRARLERSLTATVACQAELAERGVGIASVEVAGHLAWLETTEPVYRLEFDLLDGRDEKIEIQRVADGRMLIDLAGQVVDAPQAPLLASTAGIGPVGVRAVAGLDDGHEALEIALPDHPGREWWR